MHPETDCGVILLTSPIQMLVMTQNSKELYFSVAVALSHFTFFFASSFQGNAMGVDRIQSTVLRTCSH